MHNTSIQLLSDLGIDSDKKSAPDDTLIKNNKQIKIPLRRKRKKLLLRL